MKLFPQGDHYLWYCDWCDSRNLTLWTRVERGKINCCACQMPVAVPHDTHSELRSNLV